MKTKSLIIIAIIMLSVNLFSSEFDFTYSQSFSYSSNVFNLSDYDLDRFSDGHPNLSFADTADDLIVGSRLRVRYPFQFDNLSGKINRVRITGYFSPAINFYARNSAKSDYNFLSGIFTRFDTDSKRFNLNLYYGYYADNYTRDYRDLDGTGDYEKFEYDKNLYRLYAFFNLTQTNLPLFYFQIEDYYHNRYFTEYDGRAITTGIGWRKNFNDFFLRAFYYFRTFDPINIEYDIANLPDRLSDTEYESDIFFIESGTNRIGVGYTSDIRPFFSYRFEKRNYTTDLPISVAPFHASRKEKRHSFNIGCEFYFYRNLDIIVGYNFRMRRTESLNNDVEKFKDYNKHEISLTFDYNFKL